MQRSHSRCTYPADKMLPLRGLDGEKLNTDPPRIKRFEKLFHKRKSRNWLRRELRKQITGEQ